ncbi:hypothetical protein Syun_016393 [Stephania yunnanensis]|uniref:Peptidase M24 domain-containing protein n=1 Tax=Stephania yunnanensis TaxID=152371 RepID=A0AAP0J4T1_9MAGN
MATRVVALENQARLAISRPPLFLIRAGFASSCSSSSSSLRGEVEEGKPNSGEAKPGKKLADRLASFMDAIHDRSLPPELRGRRNAVSQFGVPICVHVEGIDEKISYWRYDEVFFNLLVGVCQIFYKGQKQILSMILLKNGCAPEWVELNKEIWSNVNEWRLALKTAQTNRLSGNNSKWIEDSHTLQSQMRAINEKVFRYNLIVPFGRQMFGLNWEKELDRLKKQETFGKARFITLNLRLRLCYRCCRDYGPKTQQRFRDWVFEREGSRSKGSSSDQGQCEGRDVLLLIIILVESPFLLVFMEKIDIVRRSMIIARFNPVVGGGSNAAVIHYSRNDQTIKDGNLVLMDVGCELHGYVSDLTRTRPPCGNLSPAQEELYDLILETNKECIKLCKPGTSIRQLHNYSVEMLKKGLKETGILNNNRNVTQTYNLLNPTSIGHFLGMDVHDCSAVDVDRPLKPGVVITIEPGVYIPSSFDVPDWLETVSSAIIHLFFSLLDDELVVDMNVHHRGNGAQIGCILLLQRPSLEKSSQRPALGGIINGIEPEVLVEVFFPELVALSKDLNHLIVMSFGDLVEDGIEQKEIEVSRRDSLVGLHCLLLDTSVFRKRI